MPTRLILDLSPLLYFNIQGLMAYLSIHRPDPLPNICLHTAFVDDRVHGPIAQSLYSRLITTWSSDDLDTLALLCNKPILAKRSPREKRSRSKIRNWKSQEKKNQDKSHKRHRKKSRHEPSSSSNSESSSHSTDVSSCSQWFLTTDCNLLFFNKLLLLIKFVFYLHYTYHFLYL